jgi:hypothetical protein
MLFTSRVLWIDAVCINQKSDQEKGHQIALMGDVYRNAEHTVVRLGPGDSSPDQSEPGKVLHLDRNNKKKWYELVGTPWFSRIWIIQEIAFPHKATLIYGDYEVSWDYADNVVGNFNDLL